MKSKDFYIGQKVKMKFDLLIGALACPPKDLIKEKWYDIILKEDDIPLLKKYIDLGIIKVN